LVCETRTLCGFCRFWGAGGSKRGADLIKLQSFMVTPDQIREFIRTGTGDLSKLSYDETSALCNKYFARLPVPIAHCDNSMFYFHQREWGGINVIYRARPMDNPDGVPFSNASALSYRPEEEWSEIDYFGRVSKPGEANFYGSFNSGTACFEVVFKEEGFRAGDMIDVVVGVWKIEAPLNLAEIPFSEKHYDAFYKKIEFQSGIIPVETIKAGNRDLKARLGNDLAYETLMYLAEAFANYNIISEKDYFLTNYYADRVFDKIAGFKMEGKIDGILYPSVANIYQNKNIVLTPEAVKTKLKFIQADHYGVTHRPENGGTVSFLPLRIRRYPDKEENIIWDLTA